MPLLLSGWSMYVCMWRWSDVVSQLVVELCLNFVICHRYVSVLFCLGGHVYLHVWVLGILSQQLCPPPTFSSICLKPGIVVGFSSILSTAVIRWQALMDVHLKGFSFYLSVSSREPPPGIQCKVWCQYGLSLSLPAFALRFKQCQWT